MLQGWLVILVALGYIGLLFVVASYGDLPRVAARVRSSRLIYPLSLAIYCTSWTFFGSVGLASRSGFDFLTIYAGPIIMIGLCSPLLLRIVRLAKAQNITSVADFIASRYGKSQAVAATVALIAILGSIPYIALQLKAVSSSLSTILMQTSPGERVPTAPVFGDLSAFVAMAMAAFAVLFGTRHADATEHQEGLMLAVATESIVKLAAFLVVGVFVTYYMFGGAGDLFARAMRQPETAAVLTQSTHFSNILTMTALSFVAILLLPRQFHVAVVENNGEAEIRRAAWLFPIYLVLINLFVVPIALGGLLTLTHGSIDSDMFVLALPLAAGAEWLTLVAFVGGLSAATAMVIVESVALAITVSNDLVMPMMLKRRESLAGEGGDVGAFLLKVRRVAIFALLALAYTYYRFAGEAQLASIGLLSFAAIAQLAPAFFGGLVWRQGTARGAIAGMVAGTLAWAYMLLFPSLSAAGVFDAGVVAEGPFGIGALRPQAFLGLDLPPLAHGVAWSLALNTLFFVGASLARAPASIERVQASLFVPSELTTTAPSFRLWRSAVSIEELTATVARYLGEDRTREAFASFAAMRRINLEPKHEADIQLLQYAEHVLASAIGAASSRLVLSLLLRKRTVSRRAALKLLDEANAAIQYNREVLQISLDHVWEGIAVFDKDLQLACWNRQFGELLDVPPERVRVGARLDEIVRASLERTEASGDLEALVRARSAHYLSTEPFLERFPQRGLIIEVRPNRMPDGGIVATFTDITPTVEAAEALENRVRERTEQLTRLNAELERAKAQAEEANVSKTRFLAAASHDLVQPLNAARLYVSSLVERQPASDGAWPGDLVGNIDASLEAVEEIISALLDISRLDAGAMSPEIGAVPVNEIFRQLELEFRPMAKQRGIGLTFVPCSAAVRSDRRLLRRLLQNLISNAVKYTLDGRVLVGCRRRGEMLRIDVYDQGLGIAAEQREIIFKEFHRLDQGARVARGLGLGLSIVERIGKVLGHEIGVFSDPGHGSHFWVELPIAGEARVSVMPQMRRTAAGPLTGMTILCIDNEPKILAGMQALLDGWNCRVVTATDLAEARQRVAEQNAGIDGLLVDYHLDTGNGLDAIVALRESLGADRPAILITADRSARVREEARAQNVQVLNKPVKPAALRALIAQWRARRAVAAE